MDPFHVTFVASRFRDGGVERRINRLADGMLRNGVHCTFLLGESGKGGAGDLVPAGVEMRVCPGERPLQRGLQALMAERDPARHAVLAFRATDFSATVATVTGAPAPRPGLFLVSGAFMTERLSGSGLQRLRGWKLHRRMRRLWSRADGVLTISPEIAADWRSVPGFPADKVHYVHPPVVGEDVDTLSREPVEHPWAAGDAPPVILGVGRLVRDKRFHLLVEAVRQVREQYDVRLVILGKGPEQERLAEQARGLGIGDVTDLPGFSANPYAWMRCARMLVLPSGHETFGLVLIESLFTGTPFIAMAEAKGPASIHAATRQGELVAPSTSGALAEAISRELSAPADPDSLRAAATPYDSINSARDHLDAIHGVLQDGH
ncbi:glycosyltransferase [Aquisalimonas lutea]|uniref:glycosyltransferase n=1 Tax=Aquisalimonas lutea TaxID=1327750 RepID=UPI0025B59CD5|nr:glycosyltransferase [Aquisalimonas lutea]MDN3517873.1 glycosyltransferase [Aquisalimonas lutea]